MVISQHKNGLHVQYNNKKLIIYVGEIGIGFKVLNNFPCDTIV